MSNHKRVPDDDMFDDKDQEKKLDEDEQLEDDDNAADGCDADQLNEIENEMEQLFREEENDQSKWAQ